MFRSLALSLVFITSLTIQSFASHNVGMDLSYRHLSALEYEMTVIFYRYCGGTALSPGGSPQSAAGAGISVNVQYFVPSTGYTTYFNLPKISQQEVQVFCDDSLSMSSCLPNGSWQTGVFGIEMHIYRDTVDFSTLSTVGPGYLKSSLCCRNSGTNYISQPGLVVETSIRPYSQNSSPQPLANSIPFLLNDSSAYSYSVALGDPDGDSLVYYLDTAIASWNSTSGYTYINYNSAVGASPTQPMAGITMDSLTGIVSVLPIIPPGYYFGNFAIAWKVEEWDPVADTLKGYIHRDIQTVVLPGSNINPYFTQATFHSTTVTSQDSIELQVCLNDSFEIEFVFADSNLGDSLSGTLAFDSSLFMMNMTQTGFNPATFTVSGQILSSTAYGMSFVVKVFDDNCPIMGVGTAVALIKSPCVSYSSFNVCQGTWAPINLQADSSFWTFISGDSISLGGNFNCLNSGCSEVEVNLSQNTVYQVVNYFGGTAYIDTVTVYVSTLPAVVVNQIGFGCLNEPLSVDVDVTNASSFNIIWTDTYNVVFNDTIDSTWLLTNDTGTFVIPFWVNAGSWCSVTDTFTFTVHPNPTVSAGSYSATCKGQAFQLSPSGASTYAWSPSTGLSSSIGSPSCTLFGPETYYVTGTDINGCVDMDSVSFNPESNFIAGTAYDTSGNPVISGTVYLVAYDSANDSVYAPDTATLGSAGEFLFEVTDPWHYIKVAPTVALYPMLMPTYYSSSALIQNADSVLTTYCDTTTIQVDMISGPNTGGAGFVSGIVSQGAGKGVGDPVSGLGLVLATGDSMPFRWTETDSIGAFHFDSIPAGTFLLYADAWGVSTSDVPLIVLNEGDSLIDRQFEINSELLRMIAPAGISSETNDSGISLFPNPAQNILHLQLSEGLIDLVEIHDLNGRLLKSYSAKSNRESLDISHLVAGAYLIHVNSTANRTWKKLFFKN